MNRQATRVLTAFAGFVLIGFGNGTSGVLLPAQIADYHVDKSTIGLLFATFAIGYVLAGAANGPLVHLTGTRGDLACGALVTGAAAGVIALRPAFGVLVVVNGVFGFGTGLLDAGINAYLAGLPRRAALLNNLHAFFGVGSLIGPVAASTLLASGWHWQQVYLISLAAAVPLLVIFLTMFPAAAVVVPTTHPRAPGVRVGGALALAAAFLAVYVGVEVSVGNWAFTYLRELRGVPEIAAGWFVSGYWLGLTIGRFVLNAIAERVRLGPVALVHLCGAGTMAATLAVWLLPGEATAAAGLALLGFFLGPVFPTTIAVVPHLVPPRVVATAVGVLVGVSVAGGAAFPWLAGALAQHAGIGSLLPFSAVLVLAMAVLWWRVGLRVHTAEEPAPAVG